MKAQGACAHRPAETESFLNPVWTVMSGWAGLRVPGANGTHQLYPRSCMNIQELEVNLNVSALTLLMLQLCHLLAHPQ